MKNTTLLTCCISLIVSINSLAQVGINTDGSSPNASAILDLKSTEKGLLLPRLTTSQQQSIVNPSAGLVVYNTDSSNVYFFNGTLWISMGGESDTIWQCGAAVDYMGQSYNTVQIGTQCWMKENMNYATGNSWCYAASSSYCNTYGRLYDWATAITVCPEGWHLASDWDWCVLTTYLDATVNCNVYGFSGTDVGTQMKSTSGWNSGGNGTNTSGFTSRPGGWRTAAGTFIELTYNAIYWTSTIYSGTQSFYRGNSYTRTTVSRGADVNEMGFSARCIKNSE